MKWVNVCECTMKDSEQEKIDHIRKCKELGVDPLHDIEWSLENRDKSTWERGEVMINEFIDWVEANERGRRIIKRRLPKRSPEFIDAMIELHPRYAILKEIAGLGDVG